jgi:hypothetical protein
VAAPADLSEAGEIRVAFCTLPRGARKISPRNVVNPTGSGTCGGAWLAARAAERPFFQDDWAAGPGARQPVQRDVVDDLVPGEMT